MRGSAGGFTLIELLVAAAIGLVLLGVIAGILGVGMRIQARENQNVPVQQALRASIEVIAQELRASVGPRVMYADMNGAGNVVPPGLPLSTGTSITILVPQANATFAVSPPVGYPSVGALTARASTQIALRSLADTGTTSSKTCSETFTGSDYGVLYSTLNTNFQPGAARAPDAFRVFQTVPLAPCPTLPGLTTVQLNHTPTPLPQVNWNPNTYVVEVTPVRYYVSNNTLYRQQIGDAAQVVAYGISSLTATYLPDNPAPGLVNCSTPPTFTPTPGCAPRSITLTLTSVPQNAAVQGARSLSASQIVFLR